MRASIKIGLILIVVAVLIGGSILARKSNSDKDVWLGISHQSVTYRIAKKLDLPVKSGVLVERVYRKSPAKDAGLQRGDVITAVDGIDVTDADDLVDIILDHEIGDDIKLTIVNEDGEKKITAKLDETPSRYQSGRSFKRGITIFSDDDDDDWEHFGRYDERPFLGVVLQELTSQLGDYFGVKRGRGALITEVVEDSPAETAGLKAGDVIVSINNSKVRDTEDAVDEIHDGEIGDKITITIMRDRKEMTIEAELDESDDSYGGNNFWFHGGDVHIGHLPAIPDIPAIPAISGIHHMYYEDLDLDDLDELDDFKLELKELQQEFREMQREIQTELREEFQDIEIDLRSSRML